MTARLAVFCSGYGSNFQALIEAVRRRRLKAQIALMVCDNPGAYALKRARRAGIPVVLLSPRHFKTRRAYERVLVHILNNECVDLVVLAGFMRILTPYFVGNFRRRILNIHPALLPKFKGAHAIRDAFEAGEKVTGVTVHYVTPSVDAGPVILQEKVKIFPKDTKKTLENRIHRAEHRLYPKAIRKAVRSLK